MAVKPGVLKRALGFLFFLCAVLVVYLYWHQNHELPVFTHPFRPSARADDKYASRYSSSSSSTNTMLKSASTFINHLRLTTTYNDYKDDNNNNAKFRTQWTWNCINNRCVKTEKKLGHTTSLATCNMMCGSTQLWPQPTGPMRLATHAVAFFSHQIVYETTTKEPAKTLLAEAYKIFTKNVKEAAKPPHPDAAHKSDIDGFLIKIFVAQSNQTKLYLKTDESYNLTVGPLERNLVVTIHAKTFFGARHGLETLSQLIWWDENFNGGMLKILKGAVIEDAPRFAYRGLMVDTARNFFSVDSLKRTLVGMSSCKLNVFHWHISDSQSFPFDVPSVPQLAKFGAYSSDMVYSAEDVRDVVQFAKVRGIRVVIEVDTPAHAGNGWTWGAQENLGQLAVCVNEQPWSIYCGEPPCGQLNPDNPNVYVVLEKLYKDIIELTGEDELFHLGGDEVNLECWARLRPTTSLFNFTDYHNVWGEFTVKAIERLKAANKGKSIRNVVLWSSNLSKQPYNTQFLKKNEVVVQAWGASQWPETPDLINEGYRIIASHVDAWYLDCGFGRWRETGDAACDPYRPWQTFYNHRPWNFVPAIPDVKKQFLGGEACLWTEQVGEGSLDARIWPRTAALAERLWSDPPHNKDGNEFSINEDVYTRLSTHRSRLKDRGIGPEAMWPYWCIENPGMCL